MINKSNVGLSMDAWDLVWNAGPMVKMIMLLLFSFSVISWAIIFTKKVQLKRVEKSNEDFLNSFWKATSLDTIYNELNKFRYSSLARVFRAGYQEMQKIASSQMSSKSKANEISLSGLENISRALRKASSNEVAYIENRSGFLATVGSTSPFIGLFGTVWGIMNSFQHIGSTGAASLAVVAPGISEALIATAIGLAAAIPAVMGYNYFIGRFRQHDLEIENFNADFLNIIKRNFFRD